MAADKITFYKGEKREVTATVTSKNSMDTVIIASADFELRKSANKVLVQKGTCEVSRNEATALLDLAEKGEFELKVISFVGREKVISKTLIEVE